MQNVSKTTFDFVGPNQAFISFGDYDTGRDEWTMQVDGKIFRAKTANDMIDQLKAHAAEVK